MFIDSDKLKMSSANPSLKCGHSVYSATYLAPSTHEERHVFYKENKQGKPINSNWEVAFGGLAKLLLIPGLTSNQYVVKNGNSVSGVASENIAYAIHDASSNGVQFYSLSNARNLEFKLKTITNEKDIPINFFNQLAPGFISKLFQLYKSGELTFNMASLASIMTTSYTLEEDDLHKGNFGFYVIEKDGKKEVVFFKIDHDMMLSDSVMSYGSARFANCFYADQAFSVTQRDLTRFPKLKDSGNHYWPTRAPFLAKFLSWQTYTFCERKTFAALNKDVAFQQAKWRSFLKYILLSPELLQQAVSEGFDENTSEGQGYIALVTNAAVARLARIRAVLFSLPEFRQFVATINQDSEDKLIREILQATGAVKNINDPNNEQNLRDSLANYKQICKDNYFVTGDTPFHAAIRLGNYRFDESCHDYRAFINKVNEKGQTPLDVAIEQFNDLKQKGDLDAKGIQNPLFIIQDLIQRGARKTPAYIENQNEFNRVTIQWGNNYLSKAQEANSNELMLNLFSELGKDCQLTLRMKKELSIRCLEKHIKASEERSDYSLGDRLKALKSSLNGDAKQKPDPAMQFIRQLRSRMWIVRQLRGLLGGSSTQAYLNQLLDKKLRQYSSASYRSRFFYRNSNELASEEKYNLMRLPRLDGELDCKIPEIWI